MSVDGFIFLRHMYFWGTMKMLSSCECCLWAVYDNTVNCDLHWGQVEQGQGFLFIYLFIGLFKSIPTPFTISIPTKAISVL